MKNFYSLITKIPLQLREMCFRRFLLACKSSHALAFFDWRQNNTLEFSTKPEILELI